jgi:uncharacterized OB-fold protein
MSAPSPGTTSAPAEGYLPAGLPIPVPEPDGLSAPYWNGLREGRLMVQRCTACRGWQFAPEWICHRCHALDPGWEAVAPRGVVYSWQRIWHPVHPSLKTRGPYLVVVVELPDAGHVRMVGNLLGDPMQDVPIGAAVEGVFEHHPQASPPYSLLQWRFAGGASP